MLETTRSQSAGSLRIWRNSFSSFKPPEGSEPSTYRLRSGRSTGLSYGGTVSPTAGFEPAIPCGIGFRIRRTTGLCDVGIVSNDFLFRTTINKNRVRLVSCLMANMPQVFLLVQNRKPARIRRKLATAGVRTRVIGLEGQDPTARLRSLSAK